jgi:hypothetical protein
LAFTSALADWSAGCWTSLAWGSVLVAAGSVLVAAEDVVSVLVEGWAALLAAGSVAGAAVVLVVVDCSVVVVVLDAAAGGWLSVPGAGAAVWLLAADSVLVAGCEAELAAGSELIVAELADSVLVAGCEAADWSVVLEAEADWSALPAGAAALLLGQLPPSRALTSATSSSCMEPAGAVLASGRSTPSALIVPRISTRLPTCSLISLSLCRRKLLPSSVVNV